MATDLLGEIRSEIDERLEQLRPAVAEYERLLDAAEALELDETPSARATRPKAVQSAYPRKAAKRRKTATRRPAASAATVPTVRKPRTARKRPAVDTVVREAILGVLEHGSHTIGELVVVTAMSTASLNGDLRKLAAEGVVVKTEREGKTAWSLASAA
jgi:hypothetical protein